MSRPWLRLAFPAGTTAFPYLLVGKPLQVDRSFRRSPITTTDRRCRPGGEASRRPRHRTPAWHPSGWACGLPQRHRSRPLTSPRSPLCPWFRCCLPWRSRPSRFRRRFRRWSASPLRLTQSLSPHRRLPPCRLRSFHRCRACLLLRPSRRCLHRLNCWSRRWRCFRLRRFHRCARHRNRWCHRWLRHRNRWPCLRTR